MTLYLVVAKGAPAAVKQTIVDRSLTFFEFKPDTWIIESDMTTADLATAVGIKEGESATSGLAVSIGGYAGRGDPDMWEWLRSRWSKVP